MSNSSNAIKTSPEDGFYENLTLGLIKVLNNIPRITNIVLEKCQPCERTQVTTWEQRHNIYLPDDMKKFYLSTDGFTLHWCYQYSPNDVRRVGFLHFPHLLQITLLRETIELIANANCNNNNNNQNISNSQGTSAIHHHYSPMMSSANSPNNNTVTSSTFQQKDILLINNTPQLNIRSKIFELSNICDIAKVCIVYETPEIMNPKIYLLEVASYKWQFLADSFTEYQRMSIVHLGLPYWELCFSSCGLPSWTEQLFLLLAPDLLEKNEKRRKSFQNTITPININSSNNNNNQCNNGNNDDDQIRIPSSYNILDPKIFRTKTKCHKVLTKPTLPSKV